MSGMRPSDERGIIVSFFVKIFLFLAITGVFVADGASIFFANLRASDAAAAASTACAVAYKRNNSSVDHAIRAALNAARDKSEEVQLVAVTPDTRTGQCSVTATAAASTLVVEKIGFLKKYAQADATEVADPPVS